MLAVCANSSVIVFLMLVGLQCLGQETSEDGTSHYQAMKFRPPTLTEEDEHSTHMPLDLRCDGCRAIAFQLSKSFEKMASQRSKRPKESDILTLVESVCRNKEGHFDEYGIKEVDGRRQLSGPGLAAKKAPGVMQMMGRWPQRLAEMCLLFVGELGEEEIFDAWMDGEDLGDFLCQNEDVGVLCTDRQQDREEKEEL